MPAPLFMLTGAPGAGKTTLPPELIRASEGIVVMDIDELLEDSRLLGVPIASEAGRPHWPAYGRMWQRIADLAQRVGHPVLFLSPCTPDEFEGATDCALLDCSDAVRVERLRRRGWDAIQIDEALEDAANCRSRISPAFHTDVSDPAEVAEAVLAWCARVPAVADPAMTRALDARQTSTGDDGQGDRGVRGDIVTQVGAMRPEDMSRLFTERWNAGELDAILEMYEPDAVVALPLGQVSVGHAAIRVAYQQLMEILPVFPPDGREQPVLQSGDLAMTSTVTDSGASVEVARRQADGTWRWVLDNPNVLH